MIRVAVAGYAGRMGSTVVDTVEAAEDMEVACRIDPHRKKSTFPAYETVSEALANENFDVLVDFTQPDSVVENVRAALAAGVDCVIGTSGISSEALEELASCSCGNLRVLRAELHDRRGAHDAVRPDGGTVFP